MRDRGWRSRDAQRGPSCYSSCQVPGARRQAPVRECFKHVPSAISTWVTGRGLHLGVSVGMRREASANSHVWCLAPKDSRCTGQNSGAVFLEQPFSMRGAKPERDAGLALLRSRGEPGWRAASGEMTKRTEIALLVRHAGYEWRS